MTTTATTAQPATHPGFITSPPPPLDPASATAAEALFVSWVQPSSQPTSEDLIDAVTATLKRLGARGCAAAMAAEFAEHPETAVVRMAWVRRNVHMLG